MEMLDRWLVHAAAAVVVALPFALVHDLACGVRWLANVAELFLLVPLTALTLRAERVALHAQTNEQWESANVYRGVTFALGMTLVVIISLANARSLLLLVEGLLAGTVVSDAKPGYVDYLFLSFNTSTAFSPTDTLPLTIRMKLLMMLESIISLLTLALGAARAVNILA